MNEQQQRSIEALVSALCDGVLEPSDQEQLEQMLRDSAECRQIYLQYVDMHARLTVHPHLSAGIALPASPTTEIRETSDAIDNAVLAHARSAHRLQKPASFWQTRWLAAAALACAALLGWWLSSQNAAEGRHIPYLRELAGQVTIQNSGASTIAQVGRPLHPGERLQTADDDARAVLEYADGTRVVVSYGSIVEIPAGKSGVSLHLLSGTMEVDAAPQPPDRPLIFATDHARYVVLGTRFRLYREADASRLELDEGHVRLQRSIDDEQIDVPAGYVAVATAERKPLDIQPLAEGRSTLRVALRKAGDAVAFLPTGDMLATSDWQRGLRTWKPDEAAPQDHHQAKPGRSAGLAFAGETLVQVNSDGKRGTVTRWRPGESNVSRISLLGSGARSRALSPDGLFAAESDDEGTRVYAIDSESNALQTFAELEGKGKAWCLSLSKSAEYAAAGFWNGTVRVYQLAAGAANIVFEKRLAHTPTHIALSPAGDALAVFTQKDGLQLFDLATGGQQTVWSPGGATVVCAKFTPDGRRLLAGLSDATARMWSVPDVRQLIVVDVGGVPRDVAWSESASLLATAAGEVKLWECEIP